MAAATEAMPSSGRGRHRAGPVGGPGETRPDCRPRRHGRGPRHLGLAPSAASGAGRMMLAGILSPIGRWLSLVGGCRQCHLAGQTSGSNGQSHHHIFGDFDIIRIEMLILISVSTAGCATVPRLKNDCDWVQPIRPSRKDVLTRQTKEQIAAHNESGARICKWRECSTTSEVAQYLHETLRLIKQC